MEQQRRQLLLKRNKQYFGKIPQISNKEITNRAKIATMQEIELINLLNLMRNEFAKSMDDFLNNYGGFSDKLNRIFNLAEAEVFGDTLTSLEEQFSDIQREEWNKLLPITLKHLEAAASPKDEEMLMWPFAASRAERAARNNTNSLCNCHQFETLRNQGYKYKQWHTIMDGRERATHAIANGQIVPIDQPFIIGGYRMMFPRDTRYGAPVREIINCRCSISGR